MEEEQEKDKLNWNWSGAKTRTEDLPVQSHSEEGMMERQLI